MIHSGITSGFEVAIISIDTRGVYGGARKMNRMNLQQPK